MINGALLYQPAQPLPLLLQCNILQYRAKFARKHVNHIFYHFFLQPGKKLLFFGQLGGGVQVACISFVHSDVESSFRSQQTSKRKHPDSSPCIEAGWEERPQFLIHASGISLLKLAMLSLRGFSVDEIAVDGWWRKRCPFNGLDNRGVKGRRIEETLYGAT